MVPQGGYVNKAHPKKKFLINTTKHEEIKIAVFITSKVNDNRLMNSFSGISKTMLRLIDILVVLENKRLFHCSWKGANQAMQRTKLHFLLSVRTVDKYLTVRGLFPPGLVPLVISALVFSPPVFSTPVLSPLGHFLTRSFPPRYFTSDPFPHRTFSTRSFRP